ncbi:MAG: hypothetical protein U0793_06450 [Gemmataceae bacterium]
MATPEKEPRNPFYLLLLLTGLVFILTALAYAVVPVLEEKARDEGLPPNPAPWRDALKHDGWKWLLVEVGLLVLFGLLSMGLDRYRRWKREQAERTPPRQ